MADFLIARSHQQHSTCSARSKLVIRKEKRDSDVKQIIGTTNKKKKMCWF